MAYTTRPHGTQRTTTITLVLLFHLLVGSLIVKEFAPGLIERIKPPPHIPIIDFTKKETKTPPPTTEPKQEHKAEVPTDPRPLISIDATPIKLKLDPLPLEPPVFVDPIPTYTPPTGDGLQRPAFVPTAARPANAIASWATTVDYPRVSLKLDEHGISTFRVTVGTNGQVQACEIVKSSGHARLDQATCRLVSKRAEFEPATNGKGEKIVGTYVNSISWVLPR